MKSNFKISPMERKKTTNCKDKSEEQRIQDGLKRWGKDAYRNTLSNGEVATVLRGNKIYRVSDNGANLLMEVKQSKYKVSQRTFKLK